MKLLRVVGGLVALSCVAVAGVVVYAYTTDAAAPRTGWPYDLGGA